MSKFTRKLLTFRQGGSNNSTKTTKQIREMLGWYINLCLMLGKSRGKTKQYRALCKTLIKILFNKNIVYPLTTNVPLI